MYNIIWTASIDDWQKDKKLFGEFLDRVLHVPCIKIYTDSHESLKLNIFDTLVFTSKHGVKSFTAAYQKSDYQDLKTYCFGENTYATLIDDGFLNSHKAEGCESGEALGNYLAIKLAPSSRVLIVGPTKPAFPLDTHLEGKGFDATYLPLYETISQIDMNYIKKQTGKRLQDWLGASIKCICFASPSAVSGFTNAEEEVEFIEKFQPLALAIGHTTEKACKKHFKNTYVCKTPTKESLIQEAIAKIKNESYV